MSTRFGQHFLSNSSIAAGIISAAEVSGKDTVLEIGPGKGILTDLIAGRAKKVIAVELDKTLSGSLSERYASKNNVEIVNADYLRFPFPTAGQPLKIIANLPYYIATAIIEKILPHKNWFTAFLMVQKEVGERIASKPDTKAYGAFSIFCQYYASVEIILRLGPGSFLPPPKVESVVLKFTNKMPPDPDKKIFKLANAAFQHRRKVISNALAFGLCIEKEKCLEAVLAAKIDPQKRPENLTFYDYKNLTSFL